MRTVRSQFYVRAVRQQKSPASGLRNGAPSQCALNLGDLLSLKALWPLTHLELDKLAFVQRFVSIHFDGGEVNEDILSRLTLNEPKTL